MFKTKLNPLLKIVQKRHVWLRIFPTDLWERLDKMIIVFGFIAL